MENYKNMQENCTKLKDEEEKRKATEKEKIQERLRQAKRKKEQCGRNSCIEISKTHGEKVQDKNQGN